jgi:hypothetical protein
LVARLREPQPNSVPHRQQITRVAGSGEPGTLIAEDLTGLSGRDSETHRVDHSNQNDPDE